MGIYPRGMYRSDFPEDYTREENNKVNPRTRGLYPRGIYRSEFPEEYTREEYTEVNQRNIPKRNIQREIPTGIYRSGTKEEYSDVPKRNTPM